MSQPARPLRRWPALAVAAATLAVGSILFADGRPGVVTTNAQQTFEGEITEADGQVTIVRGGMHATLPREDVATIEYATYAERFAKQLAALEPTDIDGRIALAKQAADRREFALARQALDQALELDPMNRDARRASMGLAAQLQMEARQAARTAAATTRPDDAGPARGPQKRQKGLDESQVNLVRQAELRRGDRVRVRFANNVRKRYVETQAGLSYRQFDTLPDTEQAIQILARGTRDMAEDVMILSDPAPIETFNRRIQSALVQGCATSYCHGGEHAGGFKLLTGVPDAATAITNYYLVTTWAKDAPPPEGAVFGGGTLEMVSRGRATDSVLFQYALPRAKAKHKHPPVRGWDGILRDANDRLAGEMVQWIDHELVPFRPTYSFRYSPFVPAAATAPAPE